MKKKKKVTKKNNKQKHQAFTLIELLAVIIILGILLLIAIPSVSKYIDDSRKQSYIITAKQYVKGASNLVNTGDLDMFDTNTTYYLPAQCVKLETGGDSPYGKFEPAYIVITYSGDAHRYYWTSRDTSSVGIYISDVDKLDTKLIQTGVNSISTDIGIGNRENILVMDENCTTYGINKIPSRIKADEDVVATSIDEIKPGINASKTMKREWFNGSEIDKNSVESIEITNNANVPSNAIKSWDASADSSRSVMAYYVDNDSDGKYEVYVGADKGVLAPQNSSGLFRDFNNLTSLELRYLNTSNVVSMGAMFAELHSLRHLDVSNFDTSKVTSFNNNWWSGVFYNCRSLESLDLRNWDARKANSFVMLFYGCSNLKSIQFGYKWNAPNVTQMVAMFYGCSKLESLDLRSFDTSHVTDMNGLFQGCNSLKSVDVSSFNTSKVLTMRGMFQNCSSLTTLDLSNFDTSRVTDMGDVASNSYNSYSGMFSGASNLKTIYVSNKFVTNNVNSGYHMFSSCYSLVGGNGTTYSGYNTTQEYARVDSPSQPGYFTLK